MPDQPNFVLIMTDQQRADHLSCYGNEVLKTPNIDGLAQDGTRFTRCYVACPICAPNRASMLTGRMPSAHGVRSNGIPLSLDARTFVQEMREAGYYTGLIGKAHFQNITGLDREFIPEAAKEVIDDEGRIREAFDRDMYGPEYQCENLIKWREDPNYKIPTPYYGFDQVDVAIMHGDMIGGEYERWLDARSPNHKELRGKDNAAPDDRFSVPQSWRTQIHKDLHPPAFVGSEAVEFINARAQGDEDQPFFLQVSFPDPHHPFTPPGKYWDMYSPDDIPLPSSFGKGDTPILQNMRQSLKDGTAFRWGQMPFAVTEREAREAIALTYGMISFIDHQVGLILQALEASGQMENTVVIFASDHGEMMGDHGILLKGPLHYQGSVRVPCIWKDTSAAQNDVCEDLVSSIDLPASILARAGITPYYGIQGQPFPGICKETETRDAILIEDDRERVYLNFDKPQRLRTVVTEQYRMTLFRPMNHGELFDLKNDPEEIHNLWDRPEARDIQMEMMSKLLELMIDNSDWTPAMTGRA